MTNLAPIFGLALIAIIIILLFDLISHLIKKRFA